MNGAVDARDETDLRESRRLLAQAEELGGFGSYVYTPHTGKVIWSDGLYRLYGATRESFPDPGADDPDRLLGTALDVTAEHDAQRRYQTIAARVPGMIFQLATRPGGGFTLRFVSEGSRDVYGFGPDEVLADPGLISRLVEPGDLERQRAALAAGEQWT